MPEGPEVRLTVDFLNKSLQNKNITNWVFTGGKYTDVFPDGYQEFDIGLPLLVKTINCKGKFIYMILSDENDNEYYIFHSLMMTGRWQKNYDKYCKWFVDIDNNTTIWYRDTRSFGTLIFTKNSSLLTKKLNELGPDIMTPEFTLEIFIKLLKKYNNRNICSFLMDQYVISGCGNYIKSEVLYDAKISPLRKTSELSNDEIYLLYQALCVIPRVSYNNKGLSLRDYADENGKQGYQERNLKIYGKRSARKTKTSDGRTTYWDPDIQK